MSLSNVKKSESSSAGMSGIMDSEVAVTYKWKLDGSSIGSKKTGEALISPVIALSDTKHCVIEFYPKGDLQVHQDFVSIYLQSVRGDFEADYRFYFLNSEGQIKNPRRSQKRELKVNGTSWGFPNFRKNLSLTDLMSRECEDDKVTWTLTVACEFIIDTNIEKQPLFQIEHSARLEELDDFELLIDNEEFSDVILTMKENKLHAHKNILAAKSPVFAAMFTHNMKESEEGLVDIEDVSYNVMKELLRFIYAGKINNLNEIAMDLLKAADKYSIERLKITCENHLIRNMNAKNVFEYLDLASLHNATTLKDQSMQFFKSKVKLVINQSNIKLYELNKSIIDEVYGIVAKSLKD